MRWSTSTGTVIGTGGTLQVDGTLTSGSAVTVPTGTTLDGIGTVSGTVNVQAGGHLAPGDQGPGILNTETTTLTTGANFDVILNGATAGTQYDQLNSTGTVSLGGANLNLSGSFTPVPGDVFTVVSAASVTDTFNGLAQNATHSLQRREPDGELHSDDRDAHGHGERVHGADHHVPNRDQRHIRPPSRSAAT